MEVKMLSSVNLQKKTTRTSYDSLVANLQWYCRSISCFSCVVLWTWFWMWIARKCRSGGLVGRSFKSAFQAQKGSFSQCCISTVFRTVTTKL